MRGNAAQIYEKYQQLARDASSSGDRISAENLLQHAEHYFRLMDVNGGGRNGPQQDANRPGGEANAQPSVNGGAAADGAETPVEASMPQAREPAEQQPEAQPAVGNGADPNGDATKPARRTRARRANGAAPKSAPSEGETSDSTPPEDEPSPATT